MTAAVLAERALLASIFFDAFLLEPYKQRLRPADFSSPERAAVWEAILELDRSRRVVSLVTVVDWLTRNRPGRIWATGCAALLDADYLPEESSVAEYVRVIRDAATDRRREARSPRVA